MTASISSPVRLRTSIPPLYQELLSFRAQLTPDEVGDELPGVELKHVVEQIPHAEVDPHVRIGDAAGTGAHATGWRSDSRSAMGP